MGDAEGGTSMERDHVRARILEVTEAIKTALTETELGRNPSQAKSSIDPAHRGPFWTEERGHKYIDDVEHHLRRLFRAFDLLNPERGSSVFEIGPGNCYFLFMCRDLRGCQTAGVDWIDDARAVDGNDLEKPYRELAQYAHRLFRQHLGLNDVIRHQVVRAYEPIDFGGQHDYVVATRAAFNRDWGPEEHRFWLTDCCQHLRPGGKLIVALNKIRPDSLAAWPFLRPREPQAGFKKLSIVARETIGQALMDT
jgi:hypothetical protein